ncbi:MAG: hypothetical protein P4L22_01855 [Candidatus Babeliales bacterium]|nr:hypothetical protein [Candidatus Babeliales bacterium]
MNFLNNLPDSYKGSFLVLIGVSILLFISGFLMKILYYPLLITGFVLTIYGIYLGGLFSKFIALLNSYLSKKNQSIIHNRSEIHKKD